MQFIRSRVTTLLCVAAILHGATALCLGWQAAPEARRECCERHGCASGADGALTGAPTQAGADACCAAAQPPASKPSQRDAASLVRTLAAATPILASAAFMLPLSPAILPQVSDTSPPLTVPRHVLLSVFLV